MNPSLHCTLGHFLAISNMYREYCDVTILTPNIILPPPPPTDNHLLPDYFPFYFHVRFFFLVRGSPTSLHKLGSRTLNMTYKGMKHIRTDTGNLGLGDLALLMQKPHSYPSHPPPYNPTPRSPVYLLHTAEQEGKVIKHR